MRNVTSWSKMFCNQQVEESPFASPARGIAIRQLVALDLKHLETSLCTLTMAFTLGVPPDLIGEIRMEARAVSTPGSLIQSLVSLNNIIFRNFTGTVQLDSSISKKALLPWKHFTI